MGQGYRFVNDSEAFVSELLFLHGNRQETDLSLGFGKGGDLLFLFCNVNRGPLCKVSSKNLKRMVGEIFKEILQSNNDTTLSYWRGVVGLVHLLEVLDESGLVQLDLNNVLLKFDSQLVRHLVSLESPSDEKLLMINTLLSRTRHYVENYTMCVDLHILCVMNVEEIFRYLENMEIDLYKEDVSTKVDFLRKVFLLDIYRSPLLKMAKKIKGILNQQLYRESITTVFIANVLSAKEFLETTGGGKIFIRRLIMEVSNLTDIDFCKMSLGKLQITPDYLSFLNRVIIFNKQSYTPTLDSFIKSRLTEIINCIGKNRAFTDIKGGILGASGVALTVDSYYDSSMPRWEKVLMIS